MRSSEDGTKIISRSERRNSKLILTYLLTFVYESNPYCESNSRAICKNTYNAQSINPNYWFGKPVSITVQRDEWLIC